MIAARRFARPRLACICETVQPEIRPGRSGDEGQIRALFARVFEHELSSEEWKWKYLRDGEPPPAYVAEDRAEVVAHLGGLRQRVSWRGGEAVAWNMVDAMCERRYAGRGVYRRVATALMDELGNRGSVMLYGFPGEGHRRVGERFLGFRAIAPVYMVRKALYASPASGQGRLLNALPRDWDALWPRIEARFGLVARRDYAHLRWRYLARPDKKYRIVTIDGAAAIAIVGIEGEAAYLLEFLTDGASADIALSLLAEAEVACHAEGARRIEGWFPSWTFETRLLVERAGWTGSEADHWIVTLRIFDPALSVGWLADHFYYSLGDYDVF